MPDSSNYEYAQSRYWNNISYSSNYGYDTIYNSSSGRRGKRAGKRVLERESIRKNRIETVMHHRSNYKFAYNSSDRKARNECNLIPIILQDDQSVASSERSTVQEKNTTKEFDCSTNGFYGQQQQHSKTTKNVINLDRINLKHVRIASINAQSLKKDENLGFAVELCKHHDIQILAVQESWRTGTEYIEFGDNKEQWKWINFGYSEKSRAGVGFIIGPNVIVVKSVEHLAGRILSIYINCHGLCLRITNAYAPTEVENLEMKQHFYNELRKSMVVKEMKKYKPLLLGDFNAVIGDDSIEAFTPTIGSNNSLNNNTNENGKLLLEFCQEHNLRIINTIFKTKCIHRNTHILPNGTKRRLDYIIAGTQLLRLMENCRVYNKPTNHWKKAIGTDHSMLIADLQIPCNGKSMKSKLRKKKIKKTQKKKWDVTLLRDNEEYKERFCKELESAFSGGCYDNMKPEEINSIIVNNIHDALDKELPTQKKDKEFEKPWESRELLEEITSSNNSKDQRERIKKMKLKLNNDYYEKKAMELNCASNSRKVEREFALSKKFNLLTTRNKNITEIKPSTLTNHFKDHFKKREEIEMPDELVHPETYPELFNDQKLNINPNPPDKEEIRSALKSFNNGKSYGTDKIPTEAIKYGTSSNLLITAIWMLLQAIW